VGAGEAAVELAGGRWANDIFVEMTHFQQKEENYAKW
jgi:hypothetical protein